MAWSMGRATLARSKGDPPAAMRYTEARMTRIRRRAHDRYGEGHGRFVPNYDETRTEPTVFPAAFPNLLVNGGTGIAVGMATNIPPAQSQLKLIDGICAQIDDPGHHARRADETREGPGFSDRLRNLRVSSGIRQYLETGRGSMKVQRQSRRRRTQRR